MPVRQGEATWNGGREGDGTVEVESGAFESPYSFARFEEGISGTNPEELIGGAHSACFSMAFALALERAGHEPESVHTTADVHIERGDEGFSITLIELTTEADVPGIDDDEFQELAREAKETCPVSKALASVDITLDASLSE